MSKEDALNAKEEARLVQQEITKGWKTVAKKYPLLIEDLNKYVDGITTFYRQCADDQEMYGAPLDDHRIASLLQQARACDIVRTYITSRIDSNVAQPIKNSK